jgi:aspartate beta-hydroxylase
MSRGDLVAARRLLEQAVQQEPANLTYRLNLAAVCRAQGDFITSLSEVEAVLARTPRAFHALLMKGSLLERLGESRKAALAYGAALSQAPPLESLDSHTVQALQQAQRVNQRYVAELHARVKEQIQRVDANPTAVERERLDLFLDATLGRRRIYRQEPTHYHYPGLPSIEFYERREFPWIEALEAATQGIQSELPGALIEADLTPYINYPDGVPLDQWAALNRSRQWSAFHFYHYGRRYDENCRRCPQTVAALAPLDQPVASGRMPAAMFSVLRPRTHIPPHTGVANVRLVVHLPLIVPKGCGFRVGNQTRVWETGRAWVFDDTIEHEAWNDSDEQRVILIADVWNPRLSPAERMTISTILSTMDELGTAKADSDL